MTQATTMNATLNTAAERKGRDRRADRHADHRRHRPVPQDLRHHRALVRGGRR